MRVFNFSAGPAVLPESVLAQAAAEMLDWRGTGMSVMEMSHRGKDFMGIAAKTEADLRTLLAIPEDYSVLFLQGGAIATRCCWPPESWCGRRCASWPRPKLASACVTRAPISAAAVVRNRSP